MMNEANLNIGILFCSRSKRLPCPRHHSVSAHQVIKCHDCASMWIKHRSIEENDANSDKKGFGSVSESSNSKDFGEV